MADDVYVLDLCVTGADAVSFFDDGTGNDTIRVRGVYSAVIDIHLGWTLVNGTPINAFGRYVSADNRGHQLVITGLIENAYGSNGSELITGNEMANLLGGDQKRGGAGLADTLAGGDGGDRLYGGAGDDALGGDADNDMLYGDAGNDAVYGGTGSDTVQGGGGADRVDGGGDTGDMLSYDESHRGVKVTIKAGAVTQGNGGDAEGDRISGFGSVIGSAYKDRIEMLDKSDLAGHQADNMAYGGGARDRILMGGGEDRAYGGAGTDNLFGETGGDSLYGDAGSDQLYGGFGQDYLTGGSGADHFIFTSPGESGLVRSDVITDFNQTEHDRVDLRPMDADTGRVGNQVFHLISGAFTGAAGELTMTVQGSDLRIAGDRNGDGTADFAIVVQGLGAMTAADFIF